MTFSALLAALYRRGVTYEMTAAGTLRVIAPHGLPDDLKAAMRAHKADLLDLCTNGVTVWGQDQEAVDDIQEAA
jgi:hypothetical protein